MEKMKLALRQGAPHGATNFQKFACWLIEARLVSRYNHAGIVIDGDLYHVTAAHGWQIVKSGNWSPERWDLMEFEGDKEKVRALFQLKGKPPSNRLKAFIWKLLKGYDWFGLIAFTGPKVRVSWMDYCFEWCFLAISGKPPTDRITAETLLVLILENLGVESTNNTPNHLK